MGFCLALTINTSAVFAQPSPNAERYSPVPTSADGIGKSFMGREISAVMGWQGAAWLERQERDREERTDLLMEGQRLSTRLGAHCKHATLAECGGIS